jgi:hypothetical protein
MEEYVFLFLHARGFPVWGYEILSHALIAAIVLEDCFNRVYFARLQKEKINFAVDFYKEMNH